ncbi:MAG: signal peptidase I [Anaerolineae bacterium]|nr:signal peptidase I [Anaerolineae bacterium]
MEPAHSTSAERVSLARTFGGRSLVREILETVLLTVVLFLVINTVTGRSQVNGSSMEPTLHNGQYLIISKITYWIHPPERGDIIVLHPPNNLGEDYIKRVVGLPGERVEIREGKVWADGVALDEPYVSSAPSYSGAWTLAEGEYLVLGDNRNNSNDSHSWGPLGEGNIVGKALLSYWPPENWGIVEHHAFPGAGE